MVASGAIRTDVASSPDGRILAFATDEGFARGLDLDTRTPLFQIGLDGARIVRIFFASGGARVAIASANGSVGLFEAATGTLLRRMQAESPLVAADLDASGERLLALACTGVVEVFDLERGERALGIEPKSGENLCTRPPSSSDAMITPSTGFEAAMSETCFSSLASTLPNGAKPATRPLATGSAASLG